MANGGTVIKVRDDFTKCNMLVEEVKDYDQDGNLYVTDYKFTNHLIHDAGQDSVSVTLIYATTQRCFVSLWKWSSTGYPKQLKYHCLPYWRSWT